MHTTKIAVVGLGYVGLPLAIAFGRTKLAPVLGFDINEKKIRTLQAGEDPIGELAANDLTTTKIEYTSDPVALRLADFIIVAVPTPVTRANKPDLSLVESASALVGKHLKKGATVVYESTVYPGVTEDICVPILEQESGLHCGADFKVGYSPERINPGDTEHTLEKIVKVVAGQDAESLAEVAEVYSLVCKAGVHKVSSIKAGEAAKVIENIQRDLNIALVNELSIIFGKMGIQTSEVLEAAGTKWNFHKYTPGLVGGHCIGVDPYYLVYKAEEIGYHPQVISAGRRINDAMPEHAAQLVIKGLVLAGKQVRGSRVLVLGLTFKENVKDARNAKIHDTIRVLQDYGVEVLAHDPLITPLDMDDHGSVVDFVADVQTVDKVDGVILAVMHDEFRQFDQAFFDRLKKDKLVVLDLRSYYRHSPVATAEGIIYLTL